MRSVQFRSIWFIHVFAYVHDRSTFDFIVFHSKSVKFFFVEHVFSKTLKILNRLHVHIINRQNIGSNVYKTTDFWIFHLQIFIVYARTISSCLAKVFFSRCFVYFISSMELSKQQQKNHTFKRSQLNYGLFVSKLSRARHKLTTK